MSDIAQDLGGVVRLLEKATPGVLTCSDGPHGYQHRISDGPMGVCDVFASSDAAAIAACVNFLRTHSAGIAGALRDAERWQPIESAPKDGSEVWAYNGEQARMHWIEGEGYALWAWSDELLSDADPNPEQPTHWRPLPAPPTLDSAMQQGGGGGE